MEAMVILAVVFAGAALILGLTMCTLVALALIKYIRKK